MRAPTLGGPLEASIVVEELRAHPALFVALGLLVHAVLWTMVPWLADPTPHPKITIGLALGHEWRIGYADAPPLAPWLLEIAFGATGEMVSTYVLGPLSVALAGWLVFALARRIVGDHHGMLATFLMVGVHPAAFPVGAFDSDLIEMPLVALAVLSWWRAVRERNRRYWIVFAVVLAALVHAGTQGLFVIAALAALTLTSRSGRSLFRTHDELVAGVSALFVFTLLLTPRLIWLVNNGFAGIVPGPRAGVEPEAQIDVLGLALGTVLGHIGLIVLMVLASSLFARDRESTPTFARLEPDSFGRRTVIVLALLPALLAWSAAALTGGKFTLGTAAPLVLYSGLLVVVLARSAVRIHRQRAVGVAAMTFLLLPPVLELASAFTAPWVGDRGRATNWPAAPAGRYVTDVFRTRTGRPLEFVVGDARIASAIAFASGARPRVFLDADPKRSPWIDQEQLKAAGAVVVWSIEGAAAEPPAALATNLPPLTLEAPLSLSWMRPGRLDPVRLGWAIILPVK